MAYGWIFASLICILGRLLEFLLMIQVEDVGKRIRFDALQSISNMLTFAWF